MQPTTADPALSLEATASPKKNGTTEGSTRRSERVAKRPAIYRDAEDADEHEDELSKGEPPTISPAKKRIKLLPRRNPPREAAAIQQYDYPIPEPEEIQEKAFAPIGATDLGEWHGWTVVESEPSFFNFILAELGIKDAKIQELLGMDDMAFEYLPKPVHGLIFLYQYREEYEEAEREDCPDGVWFANQTTADACATVAMLNIVMNSRSLELEQHLAAFKADTLSLHPALRGHHLSNNGRIRKAHNSFARWMDILNSDLGLKNEADDYTKKKRSTPSKKDSRKKKADKMAAFHYIAYVPIGDKVWELDGLHHQPLCLGSCGANWVAEARSRIGARIQAAESDDAADTYSLLALCQSPLEGLRLELASNIRKMGLLVERTSKKSDSDDCEAKLHGHAAKPMEEERRYLDRTDAAALKEYKLAASDIDTADVPQEFNSWLKTACVAVTAGDKNGEHASNGGQRPDDLQQELEDEQCRIRSEYASELAAWREDVARVTGRKKDYTSTVHTWVKKLAEKGVLKDIVDSLK